MCVWDNVQEYICVCVRFCVYVFVRVKSCSAEMCVRVCLSVRERHALCTLTTFPSVCRGVMDTAVARPLKSNLHSFA